MKTLWYRYVDVQYAPPLDEFGCPCGRGSLKVEKRTFEVIRTTPKGVWLRPWYEDFGSLDAPRFVRLDARKRYACPTEAEALASYVERKKAQVRIYEARALRARQALDMARRMCEAEIKPLAPLTFPAFA